jgi:uncharacterized protein with von Willebrand factor type A (vWA) domain
MLAATDAATRIVDIGNKAHVRAALRATLIHRHEHEDLFNQAFAQFWRDPDAGRAPPPPSSCSPPAKAPPQEKAPPGGAAALAEAMARPRERQGEADRRRNRKSTWC